MRALFTLAVAVFVMAPLPARSEVLGRAAPRGYANFAGVANTSGYGQSRWKTELVLRNLDWRDRAQVMFRLFPRGQEFLQVSLAPLEESRVSNLLGELFGREGMAVVEISVYGEAVDVELTTHSNDECVMRPSPALPATMISPIVRVEPNGTEWAVFALNFSATDRATLGFGNFSDVSCQVIWSAVDGEGREFSSGNSVIAVGEMFHFPLSVGVDVVRGVLRVEWRIAPVYREHVFPYLSIAPAAGGVARVVAGELWSVIGAPR